MAKISTEAYVKIALHAAKHALARVDGLLIGRVENDVIFVDDVLPLFHISTSGLLLEAACSVAEQLVEGAHATGRAATIVGYYFANERETDASTPAYTETIASKLCEANGVECLLLQLVNKALSGESGELCVKATARDQRKNWKRAVELEAEPSKEAAERALDDFLCAEAERNIVDFDDHCEDARKDWQNAWVSQA
uniref:MPN domain-containing protein n=1 Tax=Pinguiococcus pyrenoidosus TaxID=172671 RepID=A0A7R9YGM3_9STRA|mmetsp:Transcript_9245/g.34704  ORF Transcript_9245/g.34704 Transcript_9245/m.34704 type:complete len:196 (+) Transcript_9245:109-696(+)